MKFAVIYRFIIFPERRGMFLQAWKSMTELIKQYEGGLGSRLNQSSETEYIAYAQWPDRETWESAGANLPPEADDVRTKMREACDTIETIHQLEIVEDLLSK